ncbi:hypothetical protein [Thermogymnomonas acidicola]|nr:hypothetical protein [Thermogymnomonas acidicola]
MDLYSTYASGLILILSVFLSAVSMRAYRRSRLRAAALVSAVFILTAVVEVVLLLSTFMLLPLEGHSDDIMSTLILVILLLFYFSILRR